VSEVQTIIGPVDSARLGRTLMHEHIVVLDPEIQINYPGHRGWDEEQGVARASELLNGLKQVGFDSLVDMTVVPMGRDLARIRRIAENTELNIIVATGLYSFDEVPAPFRGEDTAETISLLAEMFERDITHGAADGAMRAGMLKCATDEPGMTAGTEAIIRAVARAHRRTGVPITTHTRPSTRGGLEQQRVFAEEGVELSRVIIGHCGDTSDADYLEEILARGSYIGMDRFGNDRIPHENRVAIVVELCSRGYANRMILSHDTFSFSDWRLPYFPNWHYRFLHEQVLPELRERGVGDEQIEMMLVDNPRAIFEANWPY
jgi:phosphotriesterase-related protein